jgi:hypothetical protein
MYMILVGKPEGKRPLGRPRHRWEDNIKMNLQEVGCGAMDWIELAQDRDRRRANVTALMNLRVQSNAGNFLTGCKPVSLSRRTLLHGVSQSVNKQVISSTNSRNTTQCVMTPPLKHDLQNEFHFFFFWAHSL